MDVTPRIPLHSACALAELFYRTAARIAREQEFQYVLFSQIARELDSLPTLVASVLVMVMPARCARIDAAFRTDRWRDTRFAGALAQGWYTLEYGESQWDMVRVCQL